MKYVNDLTNASEVGMRILIVVAVIALLIVLAYLVRTVRNQSDKIVELRSDVATLRDWYGHQGENIEWIKGKLNVPVTSDLPNAAHAPDVRQAVALLMDTGMGRGQAYELIYRAMDRRGKHPVAFAQKYVEMKRRVDGHKTDSRVDPRAHRIRWGLAPQWPIRPKIHRVRRGAESLGDSAHGGLRADGATTDGAGVSVTAGGSTDSA